MAKRFKTAILALLGVVMALCLAFGAWLWQSAARVNAAEGAQSQNVEHSTVAVHDPSIVLAYEDAEGNTYHEAGEGRTKVYYVFGTQIAQAKSYDLVNWTEFVSNLSDENTLFSVIPESIRNYTGNTTAQALKENCWAPDVIYNRAMGKWCMYLSVNGADYNSVIVLLVADTLDGAWSYMGEVVYSGIRSSNVASTDFEEVTGSNVVDNKYWVKRGSHLSYGVNAIDAAVTYEENGDLWMSYGSWYGGIYLLKLDNFTGLRDGSRTYENATDGTIEDNGTFTVHSDEYLGIHIAGGHQSSGEGSYLLKMGDWWYLFLSYGSYAPEGGYNMRVFRSDNIAGPYTDAAGNSPVCGGTVIQANGSTGVRVMSGYTWSWWDFSYISQGHNSAFVDDDGNAYLVYHNKYTDGTIFHVLKVHQLLVNTDGWLVTSPFESTVQAAEMSAADEIAVGLSADEIAGTYGYLFMTRSSGTYENVCREQAARLTYTSTEGTLIKGSVTGLSGINPDQTEGTWTYNSETGAFSITPSRDQYVYNGYLLYQNLEGTNIRTLAFTTVSTVAGKCSQYTYWGYRYPAAEQQAQYVVNSMALPDKMGAGATVQAGVRSNGLWDNVEVTVSYENGTFTAAYLDGGAPKTFTKSIAVSEKIAEYDEIRAGQTLLPVDTANGISISFDYSNYSSDLTPVLSGTNFSLALGVMFSNMTEEQLHLYEWQAASQGAFDQFAPDIYNAMLVPNGTARATISVGTDGSVSYYRDGVWLFTQTANSLFYSNSTGSEATVGGQTVSAFAQEILSAFQEGSVKCEYAMSNVVIGKAVSAENAYDAENFVSPSGIEVIGEIVGDASGVNLPAISDADTNGVAVSFELSAAETSDWESIVIEINSYKVALPNIDAWNVPGTLSSCNKYPETYHNSGAWNSFLNTTGYVTISISEDEIVYYLDGIKKASYSSAQHMNYNNAGASQTATVQHFIDGILSEIKMNGFTFAGAVSAEDLIVTNALTDGQAANVYSAYVNYQNNNHAQMDIDLSDSTISVVTTYAGDASGVNLPVISDADTNGVAVSFELSAAETSDWESIVIEINNYKVALPNIDAWNVPGTLSSCNKYPETYHNSGAWNSFLNTTGYVTISISEDEIVYYLDGIKKASYSSAQHMNYNNAGASQTATVQHFIDGILSEIKMNGFTFAGAVSAEDLIVTNALADGQAASVFADYQAYLAPNCERDGHQYVESRQENSCTGNIITYTCSVCQDSYTEMDYTGVTGHDYIARRTESTCVQEGSIVYTCSECGDSFTVSLPLAEHVWAEDWSKDASQHWHVCTVCGERKDAAAHTWDEGQVTSQATCTGDGVMTYTCTVCGATKTEPIAALGHSWGEWAVTKAPTRTETGMLTRTCTRNGAHTETYELPVLGDTSYTAETVAATCTQAGSITYKLTKDGQEIVVAATELPALGHNYKWTVTTAPTKEETGVLTGVCVVCEDKQEIVLPVLNAEDYEVSIVAATCESAGSETYTYVREGERYTAARIELPALGHDYEWTLGTAPSGSAGGTLTGTCTRTDCDSVTTAVLPALNDTDYEVTTKDPTCTETGTKTYVYVKDGQEITAATVTLEALGHTWGEAWLHDGTHHWHKCTVCGALSEKEAHGGGEATCVAKAVCEVCGTEYGEVDPDNHRGETYIEGYVAPTEDAEGYTGDTYCSDCGQLLKKGTALPATSHKHATVKVEAVAATCTEAGNIEYWHCSSCGNNYAVENPGSDALPLTNVTLPALGHNYEWSVTRAPTAEAEGEAQGVCSHDPSHIVTETLPVLGDGKYKAETTAATCTQAGETAYIFTLSDGTKIEAATVQIPALGHNYKWTVTTAPTKEETGVLTGVCSVCKDEQEIVLPVLNAEDYEVTTVAATCESAGSETYTYIKDGQRYMAARIELPALGHSWGEWAVTKAPTRTETGMLTRTCTRNGAHTETYELPVLGDTSYTAETVAATCTQAGSITYKLTKDGQEIVVAATELPALGHEYEWTVTTAPTKEETGVLTGVCVVCEDKQEIVLPVLNAEDYEVSIVAATCESAGSETYTYVREGERYTAARIELPALGHDYEWTLGTAPSESAGGTLTGTCTRTDCDSVTTATLPALNDSDYEVTTKDPTCTETGTKTYVYVKDGQKITAATVTLEALGHDWDEGTVTTPATCTEDGVKTFTCTRCDAEKTETIQATGHSAEEIAAVSPTCTQAGSTAGSKCSVCGEILQAPETVAALGHSWSEWTVTKQPTYTEEGEESRTCSVCNEKETRAVAALGLGQKFADEVAAVAQADTRSEKFAAISQALTTYGQLSADEKTEVSEEYAALESAIEAYNTSAQAVNTEAESAVELALRLFSSAIAAMGALAAVWFVVKKFG